MDYFEKIEGKKVFELFQELVKARTMIKVFVDGTDYERLSVVMEIDGDSKDFLFRIDPPEGLLSTLKIKQTTLLGFEFTGRDSLTYKFDTRVTSAIDEPVWLAFPDHIRRFQARNNFRIKAPRGAEFFVTIENVEICMTIDNISLGGTFCHCSNLHKELVEANPLLTDIRLQFTFLDQSVEVEIMSAERRRMTPSYLPKKFGVAYEFIKMKNDAKRQLRQQIYELQREYLQNRLKVGE
jgi:c-di-GMP-binding flagellar brake protein YcgR